MVQNIVIQSFIICIAQVHCHIRRHTHIRQTDAIGRVVLADGQTHRGTIPQVECLLKISLAAGFFSYDFCHLVLPQRCREEFRSGIGIRVDKHRHGHIQEVFVGVIEFFLSGVMLHVEQFAFRQQIIQQLHQLVLVAAGIVAHIKDQLLSALFLQGFDGGDGFFPDTDIRNFRIIRLSEEDFVLLHRPERDHQQDCEENRRRGQHIPAAGLRPQVPQQHVRGNPREDEQYRMYDFRPVQFAQTFFRPLGQRFPLDFRLPFRLGIRYASPAFRFQTGFAFLITCGGSVFLFLFILFYPCGLGSPAQKYIIFQRVSKRIFYRREKMSKKLKKFSICYALHGKKQHFFFKSLVIVNLIF